MLVEWLVMQMGLDLARIASAFFVIGKVEVEVALSRTPDRDFHQ